MSNKVNYLLSEGNLNEVTGGVTAVRRIFGTKKEDPIRLVNQILTKFRDASTYWFSPEYRQKITESCISELKAKQLALATQVVEYHHKHDLHRYKFLSDEQLAEQLIFCAINNRAAVFEYSPGVAYLCAQMQDEKGISLTMGIKSKKSAQKVIAYFQRSQEAIEQIQNAIR